MFIHPESGQFYRIIINKPGSETVSITIKNAECTFYCDCQNLSVVLKEFAQHEDVL